MAGHILVRLWAAGKGIKGSMLQLHFLQQVRTPAQRSSPTYLPLHHALLPGHHYSRRRRPRCRRDAHHPLRQCLRVRYGECLHSLQLRGCSLLIIPFPARHLPELPADLLWRPHLQWPRVCCHCVSLISIEPSTNILLITSPPASSRPATVAPTARTAPWSSSRS